MSTVARTLKFQTVPLRLRGPAFGAVTARERGGQAWSGRRPGVRDADARQVISVTRRYAVGRRGAPSRGSRPHTSHWGPYRCPRTIFISRAAEPQRIRRRGSSILLAISSTCFAVRRPRRRPAPTVTSRRPGHRSASVSRVAKHSHGPQTPCGDLAVLATVEVRAAACLADSLPIGNRDRLTRVVHVRPASRFA